MSSSRTLRASQLRLIVGALALALCLLISGGASAAEGIGHGASATAKKGKKKHRPHHQALQGSLKNPKVKIIHVTYHGGKGGAGEPGDDYPAAWKNLPINKVYDQWGMSNRNCTSWVAWALYSRNKFNIPFHEDAKAWPAMAKRFGYSTNSTPAVGSVAWSNQGYYGHVAYVTDVGAGTVTIQEYNHKPGAWSQRTLPVGYFDGYIHFKDRSGDKLTGGDLHGSSWETAFNAGSLWSIGFDVKGDMGLGVAPGTSPSIAVLANGSWEAAFQASNGSLWVVGPTDNHGDMHLGMAPGTSPSITALKGGGWEVAFQAPNNHLWAVGSDSRGDMNLGMLPGTSPSITGLDNGSWEVAFNAGPLWVVGPTDVKGDMHLGMAPGTSPSITGIKGGGWQAAFHAPGDRLWTVGNDNRGDMGLGIAAGTSPSIIGLNNGSWEIAWNAGHLWVVGPTDVKGDLNLGIDPGTSPSITAIGTNGWEVAWNAGGLWLTGNEVRGKMNLGMAVGTSPSISS